MQRSNSKANYIYSVVYQLLTVLTPLLTAPYLARVIGAEGAGIYSYFNNIASYFAMFGMLGLTNYANRYIARVRDDTGKLNYVFSSIYYMQVVLGILVSVLYIVYTAFFVKDNQNICWILFLPVLATIINLTWFYWGLEEFKITVTRSILIKFVTIVCIFLFVKEKGDLWKYCLILSAGTFCGNIPLFLLLKKYVKFVKVDVQDILVHIKPNLILFVPVLSVSVYRTMDKIMLGWLSTYSSVGYYENIDKIINICLDFITALGQVMLPKSANLVARGKIEESNRLIVKSFKFSTLFCSALVFGLISISDVFVPVFFGTEFLPSIGILMLLAPNLFLLAWGNVLKTQFLMPRGKDMAYIISTLLGAVINTVVNVMLIPIFSGIGAAIGTICAEFISLIYILWVIKSDFDIMKFFASVRYIVSGFIMMLGVVIVKQYVTVSLAGLFALIVTGAVIYAVECVILAYFKDDLLLEIMTIARKTIKHKLLRH